MIRLRGRDTQALEEELPSVALFPFPGLLILGMGLVTAGIVFAGAQTSGRLIEWIYRKIQAGTVGDWGLPVLMVYFGWVAIAGVLGVLLTLTELSGIGLRQSATLDRRAWQLWGMAMKPIQESLRPDEEPTGYLLADDRSLTAPVLFERIYLVMLLLGLIASIGVTQALIATDPLLAAQLWARYGVALAVMNMIAIGWCRTSSGFGLVVMALAVIVQVTLAVLDPNLTGAGVGLPPFTLLILQLALPAIGLVRNLRAGGGRETLIVTTSYGLRQVELQDGQVLSSTKADAPLLMVATPTASGVRLQVASADGHDKLRPFRVAGDRTGGALQRLLAEKGLKVDLQGDDESNGVAGRLGEVPGIAWVVLVSIVFLTQRTLLPPAINRLQVFTVFDAYGEEWREQGKGDRLDAALQRLLESNPEIGSALIARAQILIDGGKPAEAKPLLERVVASRQAWAEGPLVKQARLLLEKAERAGK